MEILNHRVYLELNRILNQSRKEIETEFCPYFYHYFKRFIFERPAVNGDKLTAYAEHCRSLFLLAQAKGKKVLDVGCGFGLIAIFFSLFGAKEVTGIDISDEKITNLVEENFDLRPAAIIRDLDLRRPIYKKTAAYGHFGRTDIDVPWERTDKAQILKAAIK